jgi:hypothetical protein
VLSTWRVFPLELNPFARLWILGSTPLSSELYFHFLMEFPGAKNENWAFILADLQNILFLELLSGT